MMLDLLRKPGDEMRAWNASELARRWPKIVLVASNADAVLAPLSF